MDAKEYFIRCSHCGAKNRLLAIKLSQSPSCGKCKKHLFSENSPLQNRTVIVTCKKCQAGNKVPLKRIADQPRCGKCKTLLALSLSTQGGPLILSDQNFTETVLRSVFPFLVNFHSPNCGPCKLLNPTINKIAKDYEGRLKVGAFNVDMNQYIPSLYSVGGTPTLLLFQSGKELGRLEGYQASTAITQWIGPHAW